MYRLQRQLVLLLTVLAVSPISYAEVSIDRLIEQAKLAEGPVPVRDLPRFKGARKILVSDIGFDLSGVFDSSSGVELILVSSIDDAMQYASEVDAIIGFCDEELFSAADNLIWVQIYSAGAERCLPVPQVASGEVVVSNMQKMGSPIIAEHAIAMALSLARNLPQFGRKMNEADWNRSDTTTRGMTPVAGKTLLVAGLGGIGTEVARLGAALGMRVFGTRNSSRRGPDFVEYVGFSHELNELAAEADIIVNALPLTEATRGVFDKAFFAAVKKGAIFVNVGRGQTVQTEELVAALESGHLSGAGLDVTEPEPLPADHPLWKLHNVIVTPHVAGVGGEPERNRALLIENLRRYAAGDRLLNVVDPQKGY